MCSIAGAVGRVDVKKKLEIQKHRAPDDQGIYEDQEVVLAMGRLSIIDLTSEGLCPYREDDFVLAYNGEIYNYLELKKELKSKGWVFRTTSDTEVLMKCWREWGWKMFDKLNGMFAFAIYDSKKKILILARDIAGEKPLYYYHKGNKFLFSSEAKAIHSVVDLKPNGHHFFEAFQHCLGETLWKDVYEIPAANYAVYSIKDKSLKIQPYWEFKPRYINLKSAQDELENLLEDAVNIRTRSDVPYALYYSKGIDSSLISTFHDFKHRFYFDDTKDWKDDFFKTIDKVVWHLDFPVGSLSAYPLWKLAERASKKVKVVLSGEGADEIFGGYVRYLPVAREWELKQGYPSYSNYLFAKYFSKSYLEAFARLTARNDNIEFVQEKLRPYFEMFEDPVNAMGFAYFKLVMPSLLQMGDRMAGAWGIENRCPFLDKRIIEFGFSLPPRLKISGLEQKIMLRRILAKRGLTTPLKMEKKGLSIIFNKWFDRKDWDRGLYFKLLNEKWRRVYKS